jgi:phosphoglycolate phosphatase
MRSLGCSQSEVAYVGDTPEDIEMGKRAGVLTVGVRSAYPTSWKLESQHPDIFLKSLTELLNHF